MFKIELENQDFRKSLYFYMVDAENNGLRQGDGIIQWTLEKWVAIACQRPDMFHNFHVKTVKQPNMIT